MIATEPAPYTASRIAGIVQTALHDAGALGVLPTPLDALRRAAGIELLESAPLRAGVLGATWFETRTIYVDPAQSPCRRRFTEAHELVHALCPWHHAVLREDTSAELFGATRDALEAEANAGAAMLIFQGPAFARLAAGMPCDLDTVRTLAAAHGASLHATLHHFVEADQRPVAMLAVGRFPAKDGALPVWRGVESPAFRARHGPALGLAPHGVRPGSALHALVERARTGDVTPVQLGAGASRLRLEAHYNRHAFLVLVSGTTSARRG